MPKYTREQLLFFLKKKATELKRTPRIKDMKNPSASSYVSRFGSWNNAVIEAALKINLKKNMKKRSFWKTSISLQRSYQEFQHQLT